MLEFIFSAEKRPAKTLKILLLNPFKQFPFERIGKYLNESEIATLEAAIEEVNFSAEQGQKMWFYAGVQPLLLVGTSNKEDLRSLRALGADLYHEAKRFCEAEIVIDFLKGNKPEKLVIELAAGMEKAAYRFDKYLTKQKPEEQPRLEVVYFNQKQPKSWPHEQALFNAVRYARDLGNEAPNILTPYELAMDVKRLEYLGLKIELFDAAYIKQHQMGLIEAVARGSANPPYVAVMKWYGRPQSKDWDLGLVGKGVTYDAGGISLKTDEQQPGEKHDMAGAGSIIAAMKACALQKLPLNAIAVLPLVENMPAGNAYKPDDVLISLSGQTVEVVDTDGEGRLILADALWWCQKEFKVKVLVDMARLTGSTEYIFGGHFAAVLGNDALLMQQIKQAADLSGERVWELPMAPEFDRQLNSEVADMKNVGKRMADSSQATAFLQRYIQKGVRWLHIDMAGCEVDEKKMATGYGVELLNHLMKILSGKK